MILSNTALQEALDESRLIITPEPSPREPTEDSECPYQTTAVDLALADEIAYFKEGLALDINLSQGGFANLFGPNSETRTLTHEQPFVLRPNRMVLGRTRETVTLPFNEIEPVLAARVEGRSSYARCGLLVHFTAPTIHAGFSGTITLELINLGPCNISLYPGEPICQLIVEEVAGVPFPNESQFHGQKSTSG